MNRRDFLTLVKGTALGAGGLALLGPIVAYFYPAKLEEMPSEPIPVGPDGSIAVGESRTVSYGRWPAIVVNTPDGLKAYSAVCTHFGCIVKWDPAINQFACPCHAGFFSVDDGSVISGPPPAPLLTLPISVESGTITIGVLEQ